MSLECKVRRGNLYELLKRLKTKLKNISTQNAETPDKSTFFWHKMDRNDKFTIGG
jgi:hypothetical protein